MFSQIAHKTWTWTSECNWGGGLNPSWWWVEHPPIHSLFHDQQAGDEETL